MARDIGPVISAIDPVDITTTATPAESDTVLMRRDSDGKIVRSSLSSVSSLISYVNADGYLRFEDRDALVTYDGSNTPPNDAVASVRVSSSVGAIWFVYDGSSTAISDLPGWVPVPPVYLEHFGVVTSATKAGATTDYTTELQAAMDATKGDLIFSGWVKITDKVIVPNDCRPVMAGGAPRAGVVVDTDFNLAATSIVQAGTSEPGPELDIGIYCKQGAAATSGNRADLVQYPWALDLSNAARTALGRVRIEQAYDGINGIGNCGGLKAGAIEISCFNEQFNFDGPLDFIDIENLHVWPFGFAGDANLMAIYTDGTSTGTIARADGMEIDTLQLFKVRLVVNEDEGQIGSLQINSMTLDGDKARLVVQDGKVAIGILNSTKTSDTDPAIEVSGGDVDVSLLKTAGSESHAIRVTGGSFHAESGEIWNASASGYGGEVTGGLLSLGDGIKLKYGNTRSVPFLKQSGTGKLRSAARTYNGTISANTAIEIGADVADNFIDSTGLVGQTVTLPSGLSSGFYRTREQQFTTALDFATTGDLSVSYTNQAFFYSLDGDYCRFRFRALFTPTFTTSSGKATFTLPFTPSDTSEVGVGWWDGLTLSGVKDEVILRFVPSGVIELWQSGNSGPPAEITASEFSSGTQVQIFTSGVFRV